MKNPFLAVIILLLMGAPARADTLVTRVDTGDGRTPGYSLGVITPFVEAWSFGNGSDLEIGRLWPVSKSKHSLLLLGAYGAVLPNTAEYYLIPWLTAVVWSGRWRSSLDVAGYVPVNGGTAALLVSDAFLGYQVTPKLKVGVGTGFYHTDTFFQNTPIGPSLKFQAGKRTNVSARYLFGEAGANTFRFQVNRNF